MSWKKNGFSYLTWLLYTITVGGALTCAASTACTMIGAAPYWGILAAVIFFLIVGNIVLFIHRFAGECAAFGERNRRLLRVLEAAVAFSMLSVGIFLRVKGMDGGERSSCYYDMAKVVAGQEIPPMTHGALYYYVLTLRGLFMLVGNHFLAGIWLQIALQLVATAFVYLGVRRLAGVFAAMIVLGFFAFGPYMIGNALVMSPEMLFLCVFAVTARLAAGGLGGKPKPLGFFFVGILMGFCLYMDLSGGLLPLLAIGVIFSRSREERGRKTAVFFNLLGTLAGFFMMLGANALAGGKSFADAVRAWGFLYRPGTFQLPAVTDVLAPGPESLILLGLMTFGIFGFWCDKEREYITICMLGACAVMGAGCYGMFTEEMPGFLYFYLLLAVTAGMGVGQCFKAPVLAYAAEEEARGGTGEAEMPEGSGDTGGAETPEGSGGARDVETLEGSGAKDAETSESGGAKDANMPEGFSFGEKTELKQGGDGEDAAAETVKGDGEPKEKQVHYIENPLPLPKKHVKRVLDFPAGVVSGDDDFDHPVPDDDDFDI